MPIREALVKGFNGAATLQSRKCACQAWGEVPEEIASMGPRLFSRGNLPGDLQDVDRQVL